MIENKDNYIHQVIRESLESYSYAIANLKRDLGKRMVNNLFVPIGFPFEARKSISWILDELQRRGEDISPYLKDLEPLDREHEEFIEKHLSVYLDQIEDNLKLNIGSLHPESTHDGGGGLFIGKINTRTGIESLVDELEKYHRDVSEYRKQIAVLDDVFKRLIPLAIKMKTYAPEDFPWAPKEYWWLHLEEQYGYPDEIID